MFDADRNRHVICRDSYETCLKQKGMEIKNYAVMGCTAPKGETLMTDERMRQGGLAVIEFGRQRRDLDWKGRVRRSRPGNVFRQGVHSRFQKCPSAYD